MDGGYNKSKASAKIFPRETNQLLKGAERPRVFLKAL